jgi:hypothetical protein
MGDVNSYLSNELVSVQSNTVSLGDGHHSHYFTSEETE